MFDLGPEGAGIEHHLQLPQQEMYTLVVNWRQQFSVPVKIRHSKLQRLADQNGPAVYHSGAEFFHIDEAVEVFVDSILIDEVKRKVSEWEANLTGARRDNLPHLKPGTRKTELPVSFVWFRFVNGSWHRTETRDPNQPIDGFAVRDSEDPAQIELLCSTYEAYDNEDRQMLRMMAHLAIAERG